MGYMPWERIKQDKKLKNSRGGIRGPLVCRMVGEGSEVASEQSHEESVELRLI